VAAVAFNRGLGFVQGLYQPYFSNAVSASLSGLFTRRLHGSIDGSYNDGQIGVVGQGNGLNAYAGSERLRFALNRITAVYGEYTAYRYRFASAADVVPGLPTHLNRQGVRAGLTLWLPLFP